MATHGKRVKSPCPPLLNPSNRPSNTMQPDPRPLPSAEHVRGHGALWALHRRRHGGRQDPEGAQPAARHAQGRRRLNQLAWIDQLSFPALLGDNSQPTTQPASLDRASLHRWETASSTAETRIASKQLMVAAQSSAGWGAVASAVQLYTALPQPAAQPSNTGGPVAVGAAARPHVSGTARPAAFIGSLAPTTTDPAPLSPTCFIPLAQPAVTQVI